MIPGPYPLEIYQGDTFYGPLITLPDLASFGGPSDLTAATIAAQIREKETDLDTLASFTIDVIDEEDRILRITLDPEDTAGITVKKAVWDLQITQEEWVGTPLRGRVTFMKEVTR